MDSNEGRRSKVPAGTFRASSHPPAKPAREIAPPVATPPPPPSGASARPKPPAPPAATPTKRVGTPSGAPALAPPTPVDGRGKFTNTLVGVTSTRPPAPPAAGPVLAPPPWRGASAYEGGGQDPQPRVSAISSPGAIPSVNPDGTVVHPDDRRVPNTRITAAAPPAPPQEAEEPSPATAAIGDAIQQLLDAQTAVSMEGVQDTGSHKRADLESAEFLRDSAIDPVRESQIEVVRDSAIEVEQALDPVRPLPPAAPVARKPGEAAERPRVEPSAVPEPRVGQPSARWSAPPAPVVNPPSEPAMTDRELAAYSFVEPERDSSFAPAEVGSESAAGPVDDSNLRLGAWVAAAIVIVGVGGWALTRGGFQIPPHTPAAAGPVIAAPPPQPPPVVAPVVPGSATTPEVGDVEPEPAKGAPVVAPSSAPSSAPREHVSPSASGDEHPHPAASRPGPVAARATRPPAPSAKPAASDEPEAAPAPPEPPSEAQLAAAVPEGPLPETPTRDNVQSALDAKRDEVLACAAGMHGVAEVDLTVSNNGAVTHAVVAGDFAGTPAGSCIARVVRTARFAPFSKPRFRVLYPFSL